MKVMPVRYSSSDLIKLLEADGWILVRVKGSHHHFKHPTKKGIVTVAHPEKDTPQSTALNILRQAGLR
jgi:predicted RNA binding protein YcfA (HicA-like mRNA interferase family)